MECQALSSKRNKEFVRPSIRTQHLTELVCPVCYEYMQPPIMMCESGHSICALCHELMSECPQCHGELTYRRSSALEALTAVMMFPCKHCNQRFSLEELETHHCFQDTETDHSPIATCIIGQVYGDCVWSGPSIEMSDHCSKYHAYNYWTSSENFANWKYSDLSSVGVQNVFVCDLSTAMFVIVQKFNSIKKSLCWNLSCECTNNERYDYEIQIFHKNECAFSSKTQIDNAFSIMTFFPSSNEIAIGLEKVLEYVNENNVIIYKIVINKRYDSATLQSVNMTNIVSVQTNKNSDEIIEKSNCVSKAWSSVVLFYNTVKKFLHL